jgi:hypothetical protein
LRLCPPPARQVGDFGLSQIIGGDIKEVHSSNYGTLTHAAPELVVDGLLTKAADVFSYGVLLLEMINGRRVWKGRSFMQILSSISSGGPAEERRGRSWGGALSGALGSASLGGARFPPTAPVTPDQGGRGGGQRSSFTA